MALMLPHVISCGAFVRSEFFPNSLVGGGLCLSPPHLIQEHFCPLSAPLSRHLGCARPPRLFAGGGKGAHDKIMDFSCATQTMTDIFVKPLWMPPLRLVYQRAPAKKVLS